MLITNEFLPAKEVLPGQNVMVKEHGRERELQVSAVRILSTGVKITGTHIDVKGNAVVDHRTVAKKFAEQLIEETPGLKADVWQKHGKTRVYLTSPEKSRMGFAVVKYDGGIDVSNVHAPTKKIDVAVHSIQAGDIVIFPDQKKSFIVEERHPGDGNDLQFKVSNHQGSIEFVTLDKDTTVKKLTEGQLLNKSGETVYAQNLAHKTARRFEDEPLKTREYSHELSLESPLSLVRRQTAQEFGQTPEFEKTDKAFQSRIIENKFEELRKEIDKYPTLQNAAYINTIDTIGTSVELQGTYIGSIQTRDEFALIRRDDGKIFVIPDSQKRFNYQMLGKAVEFSGNTIKVKEPQIIEMQIERFGRKLPNNHARIIEGQQIRLHGLDSKGAAYEQTYKIGDDAQCRTPIVTYSGDNSISGARVVMGKITGISSKTGISMTDADGKQHSLPLGQFDYLNKYPPMQQNMDMAKGPGLPGQARGL